MQAALQGASPSFESDWKIPAGSPVPDPSSPDSSAQQDTSQQALSNSAEVPHAEQATPVSQPALQPQFSQSGSGGLTDRLEMSQMTPGGWQNVWTSQDTEAWHGGSGTRSTDDMSPPQHAEMMHGSMQEGEGQMSPQQQAFMAWRGLPLEAPAHFAGNMGCAMPPTPLLHENSLLDVEPRSAPAASADAVHQMQPASLGWAPTVPMQLQEGWHGGWVGSPSPSDPRQQYSVQPEEDTAPAQARGTEPVPMELQEPDLLRGGGMSSMRTCPPGVGGVTHAHLQHPLQLAGLESDTDRLHGSGETLQIPPDVPFEMHRLQLDPAATAHPQRSPAADPLSVASMNPLALDSLELFQLPQDLQDIGDPSASQSMLQSAVQAPWQIKALRPSVHHTPGWSDVQPAASITDPSSEMAGVCLDASLTSGAPMSQANALEMQGIGGSSMGGPSRRLEDHFYHDAPACQSLQDPESPVQPSGGFLWSCWPFQEALAPITGWQLSPPGNSGNSSGRGRSIPSVGEDDPGAEPLLPHSSGSGVSRALGAFQGLPGCQALMRPLLGFANPALTSPEPSQSGWGISSFPLSFCLPNNAGSSYGAHFETPERRLLPRTGVVSEPSEQGPQNATATASRSRVQRNLAQEWASDAVLHQPAEQPQTDPVTASAALKAFQSGHDAHGWDRHETTCPDQPAMSNQRSDDWELWTERTQGQPNTFRNGHVQPDTKGQGSERKLVVQDWQPGAFQAPTDRHTLSSGRIFHVFHLHFVRSLSVWVCGCGCGV